MKRGSLFEPQQIRQEGDCMAAGDEFSLDQCVARLVLDARLESSPSAGSHGPLTAWATGKLHHPRVAGEVLESGLKCGATLGRLAKCHPHTVHG